MLIGDAIYSCFRGSIPLIIYDFPEAAFAFGATEDSLLGEVRGDGFDGAL